MKKIALFISILIFLLCGCSGQLKTDEHAASAAITSSDGANEERSSFEMQLLDVGQGLCILIESDGHYMLYDGGGRDYSSFVVSYLTRIMDIDHLDLMIASHYDDDHIAGLIGVMNAVQVDQLLCPDYSVNTQIYQSFIENVQIYDIPTIQPSNKDVFELGSAKIEIVNDGTLNTESENDRSIACTITYGNNKILIPGDCEEASEQQIITSGQALRSDVYVAGHHGSATSSTEAFLHEVSPKDVLISCGAENPYGHPAKPMLDRIASIHANIYRTDKQGTIILHADQASYWFEQEPCEDWTPGEYIEQTKEVPADTETFKYILNTNSKLIHRPECDSVRKMSEKNKEYTNRDIESLKKAGYRPCHNCNPE